MSASFDRRTFNRMLAAGLAAFPVERAVHASAEPGVPPVAAKAPGGPGFSGAGARAAGSVEAIALRQIGWCPNNARLPILHYHAAVPVQGSDPAAGFEALFARNGWPPQWRNGVYTFHHYHSTAHEVLGISGGSARLVLGGPGGREVMVRAGDVLLLPTGTGHCELEKSDDFAVVGAYPPGQHWDICRVSPDANAVSRMQALPFPRTDPVQGAGGALGRHWS